jgi:hypothetical protein
METLKIELLNPKAKQLLIDLMDLKLIRISKPDIPEKEFFKLLNDIRQNDVPSLEDIQKEVKIVRKQMNKKE